MGTQLPPIRDISPQFLAHVYCGQMAVWIKVPLGTELGLGPGHIVLDGAQLPHGKAHSSPTPSFRPMSIVAKRSPISATAELLCSSMSSANVNGFDVVVICKCH